jgi:ribosomal protein S18 acetylase RimI-like enzyme
MGLFTSASRFADYYRRHGLWATFRRAVLAMRRALFSSRSVLFYCDLSGQISPPEALPSFLKVERKVTLAELGRQDLEEITSFWNPEMAHRNIKERFAKGASLWLIRAHDKLAGYGWTLQGRTIEPHCFPLGTDDVQFLDFHVFSQYRGRAIDWFLMTQILHRLATDGLARAFGEAGEWNHASLSSFKMTPFRHLGAARKLTIFGRTIVCWTEDHLARQVREHSRMRSVAVTDPKTSN